MINKMKHKFYFNLVILIRCDSNLAAAHDKHLPCVSQRADNISSCGSFHCDIIILLAIKIKSINDVVVL